MTRHKLSQTVTTALRTAERVHVPLSSGTRPADAPGVPAELGTSGQPVAPSQKPDSLTPSSYSSYSQHTPGPVVPSGARQRYALSVAFLDFVMFDH